MIYISSIAFFLIMFHGFMIYIYPSLRISYVNFTLKFRLEYHISFYIAYNLFILNCYQLNNNNNNIERIHLILEFNLKFDNWN